MEQQVTNLINFGLGCLKAVSGGYAQLADRVKSGVSEIISKGEESEDHTAVRMREVAYKATRLFRRGDKIQKNGVA